METDATNRHIQIERDSDETERNNMRIDKKNRHTEKKKENKECEKVKDYQRKNNMGKATLISS